MSACFSQVGGGQGLEDIRLLEKFCFKGKRTAEERRTRIVSLLRTGELSPHGVEGAAAPSRLLTLAVQKGEQGELEGAEGRAREGKGRRSSRRRGQNMQETHPRTQVRAQQPLHGAKTASPKQPYTAFEATSPLLKGSCISIHHSPPLNTQKIHQPSRTLLSSIPVVFCFLNSKITHASSQTGSKPVDPNHVFPVRPTSRSRGRFSSPSALPWEGPVWNAASSSGLPSSRKMSSYWRESRGGLRG